MPDQRMRLAIVALLELLLEEPESVPPAATSEQETPKISPITEDEVKTIMVECNDGQPGSYMEKVKNCLNSRFGFHGE